MATIRKAGIQDAAAIASVQFASWRTTYAGIVPDTFLDSFDESRRAEDWRERLDGKVDAFVADLADRTVGFICGGAVREQIGDCDAELYAVYLIEGAQRSGIGTGLCRALAASLRRSGFRSMGVWVLETNPAKHFYEKLGARCAGQREIEIAGAKLGELGYAWSDLEVLARDPNGS